MIQTLVQLNEQCVRARQFAELLETTTQKREYRRAQDACTVKEWELGMVDVNREIS